MDSATQMMIENAELDDAIQTDDVIDLSKAKKPKTKPAIKKSEVIEVIGVTPSDDAAYSDYPGKINEVIGVIANKEMEVIDADSLPKPCFLVRDKWFEMAAQKRKPGVWRVSEKQSKDDVEIIFQRICSPLHVEAVCCTSDSEGREFGRLLRFKDTFNHWRKWAMPMKLLRGNCDELRGELLQAGVEIEQANRQRLADYIQWQVPKERITAAVRGGWTASGSAFVMRDRIIGDEKVYFQSEVMGAEGEARTGGSYQEWQKLAALSSGNPVLILSLCVSFAGPLLALLHQESGGVHWVGDSSTGKSTGLELAASVWGGEDFKRSWRATANGLEGAAALLSDTCLCLDEISDGDPKEVGQIIYSLGNGTGKQRANRVGSARHVNRWRLSIVSTGERTTSAAMLEGGKQAKAGQLVRLVNLSAARQFGAFDNLHDFDDGRQFADHLKTETKKHYGHAGVKFIEHLLTEKIAGVDFGGRFSEFKKDFSHGDAQAGRVALRFGLYAMAGEMAINAGILPLKTDEALDACIKMYEQWLESRGAGITEHKQILQNVIDFIDKHGDTRFTDKSLDDAPKTERAGWFTGRLGQRVYLFTSAALLSAGGNFDFKRVLDALDSAGWIIERDTGKRCKTTAIHGTGTKKLYWILQGDADA